MGYVIKMPKLGLEMEQGTVLEWAVGSGESAEKGDLIAEVESEKSIGEVEARDDGTLRRVYVEEGESVPPGTPIGVLAAPDADISDLEAEAEAELETEAPEAVPSGSGDEAATAETAGDAAATSEAGSGATAGGESASPTQSGGNEVDVRASPRAEKRAEELTVDLTSVDGTGPQGAITAEDVEAAAETAGSDGDQGRAEAAATDGASAAEAVKASPRAEKRAEELGVDLTTVEGTGFEGAVTEEDVEAAAESAEPAEPARPSTVEEGANIRRIDEVPEAYRYRRVTSVADPSAGEALFETMDAVRAAFEERVRMSDVLLAVASAALADCPALNGTYAESTHQVRETQDVALAVDTDDELTAGVIHDLEARSLTEIVDARTDLGGGGETEGATFTLANSVDAEVEGRLINPPCVACLEVDPSGERAVPDGDGVDLKPLVTADLTYDTRAVAPGEAQAFLKRFFEHAESATELVLSTYRGHE
jgi:pyruvate dehydrogenase E2 component (dihydrolipoamide acetyltransferase)